MTSRSKKREAQMGLLTSIEERKGFVKIENFRHYARFD